MHFTSRTYLPPNPIVGLSDKIAQISSERTDFIPMQQGDFSIQTPPEVIEAAYLALRQGYTKYAPAAGYPQLRKVLARKLRSYNRMNCDPETQILVTQGSAEALYLAVNTLLESGDEAILPAPYYPPYNSLIRAAGATPRYVDSTEENGWRAAPEDIKKAINPKTRLVLINTPNNPTGEVYPRSYLEEIGEIAANHDLTIVSDEAYEALVFDGAKHVSPASIDSVRENAVGVYSFSKTFAMTGWRLGYLCGPREFIERASVMHNLVIAHVSSHIQFAGLRAMAGAAKMTEPILQEMDLRRRTLVNKLNELPGVSCKMPKGTFYAFPDFRDAEGGCSSQELADRLIRAGVGTAPGSFFGSCAEGYQRLSYSKVTVPQINEAVTRMKKVLGRNDAKN